MPLIMSRGSWRRASLEFGGDEGGKFKYWWPRVTNKESELSFSTFLFCLVAYHGLSKNMAAPEIILVVNECSMYLFILVRLPFYCKNNIYAKIYKIQTSKKKLLSKYNLIMTCNILVYTLSGFFLSIYMYIWIMFSWLNISCTSFNDNNSIRSFWRWHGVTFINVLYFIELCSCYGHLGCFLFIFSFFSFFFFYYYK